MTYYVLTASSWLQEAIEGFGDLRRAIKLRAARRASYKRTLNELSKLTDHELRDIGICRGDIHNIASGDITINRGAEVNENLKGSV